MQGWVKAWHRKLRPTAATDAVEGAGVGGNKMAHLSGWSRCSVVHNTCTSLAGRNY